MQLAFNVRSNVGTDCDNPDFSFLYDLISMLTATTILLEMLERYAFMQTARLNH